jgi:hypothetical protein
VHFTFVETGFLVNLEAVKENEEESYSKSDTRFSTSGFFHESVAPGSLSKPLMGHFESVSLAF